MSNKKQRKSRNTFTKKKPDMSIPIPMELLGSDEDPCFGKLFDPRTNECQRCGDSEICAIAMGQKNHLLREKVESKQSFKDMEETKIITNEDKKVIYKNVKKRIREMVKMAAGKYIDIALVVDDVFASYAKDGYTQIKIKKVIKKMAEKSNFLTIKNEKIKWSSQK